MYYLQSRYYDPNIGRFINADNYPSTGQGLLGNNMFAYCNNSPIAHSDSAGTRMVAVDDTLSGLPELKYDVPMFQQNGPMCWAYSQAMIEAFRQGWGDPKWARRRAKMIGIDYHGLFEWEQAGWPLNLGDSFDINDVGDIFYALQSNGPFYAVYDNYKIGNDHEIHMVVVTGVNPQEGLVYTNNPWNNAGSAQSFEAFLKGVAYGNTVSANGMVFDSAYYAT